MCQEIKNIFDFSTFYRRQPLPLCKQCHKEWKKRQAKEQRLKNKTIPMLRYKTYQRGAKKREYKFNLTFEEFYSFWQNSCSYCGSEIETIGLDRVNNKIGYDLKNIVSCCTTCNLLKRALTKEDFLIQIIKIYNHSVQNQDSKNTVTG